MNGIKQLKPVFFIGFSTLLVSCIAPYPWTFKVNHDEFIKKIKNVERQYPDASAIYLINEAYLELNENRGTILKRHIAIKILNRRGLIYANVTLPYARNTVITHIKARTILKDGIVIPLSDNQIFDINLFSDFIFYSDVRAKRFTMPAVETGCVVEYEWTQQLPRHYSLSRWDFQKEEPVILSKITILNPGKIPFNSHFCNKTFPVLENIEHFNSFTKYHWSAENIPPMITEAAMPPDEQVISHLLFSAPDMESWEDAAAHFKFMTGNRFHPDAGITETVRQLTQNITKERDRLRILFEYVRDNIRYIAIEIGIGGYQPHEATLVFQNRYGDCKDMVGLLISMASILDITVYPALISNWYHGKADEQIVNLSQFNHVIALARLHDGTEIWMDPTEKFEPFGTLPWYDQQRMGLVIDRKGSLQKTPSGDRHENISSRYWSVDFYQDGQATGTLELSFQGTQASELRRQLSDIHPQEITSWFGQELLTLFPVKKYYVIQVDHLNDLDRPLKINSGFISNKITFKNQNLISLYPGSFTAFKWARLFPDQDRQYPINLKHPITTLDEIHIRYPENWQYLCGSQSDSLITPAGKYIWSIKKEMNNTLIFKRLFQINQRTIQPSEYSEFVDFLSYVASGDQTLIQFKTEEK